MWNKQRITEVCRALLRKPWMLLAGALGIALLLAGTLGARCTGESDTETVSSESDAYRHALESQIASALAEVDGVGKVRVVLTLESGEQYLYEGSKKVGSVPPRVLGAAVICEGGGSDRIRREVTDLVAALCRLPANRIHVAKMD